VVLVRGEKGTLMSTSHAQASFAPVLFCVEPQLFVSDMTRSAEYYMKKLGFRVIFTYGEPPFYGQVGRDGVRLNLRCVDVPFISEGARRNEEALLSATILVTNLVSLYSEFQTNEVAFSQMLRKEPWGSRTFIVADPDGNLLCFAGPAE
jgi:catechol 2,3-dioxygenase-like lactoylglutathione lyase family enzyme